MEKSVKPFVSACCHGERCNTSDCGEPAEHKVEESILLDDPIRARHPLTAYLCHSCFRTIMGPAADRSRPSREGGAHG